MKNATGKKETTLPAYLQVNVCNYRLSFRVSRQGNYYQAGSGEMKENCGATKIELGETWGE